MCSIRPVSQSTFPLGEEGKKERERLCRTYVRKKERRHVVLILLHNCLAREIQLVEQGEKSTRRMRLRKPRITSAAAAAAAMERKEREKIIMNIEKTPFQALFSGK